MGKRLYALTLILCCFIAFSVGYFVKGNFVNSHKTPRVAGNVYVTIESPTGMYDVLESNIITDIGEQAVRNGVCGSAVDVKYIALGNSTVSQSKMKLDVEYARAEASRVTWIKDGDYAFNITRKFTFTETVTLNAAAAHWSGNANANDCFALANFQQTTFQANWNLTITWVFIFDAN